MHDYHLHTHYCRHAAGSLEEYARAALRRGLSEICFTPHVPLPGFRPGFWGDRIRMDIAEFPRYVEELEQARRAVPGVRILCGVEADYIEGAEEQMERFLSSHPFDLVLMSVHFVRKWPGDAWVFDLPKDGRPLESIYDDYLEAVRRGIATGLFDCVAHMDLVKQPGHPLMDTHRAEVHGLIRACRDQGMSAEVNMSGARKPVGEPYPSWEIVRLMLEEGLPLVPSSDSHDPAQVAAGFEALESTPLVRYRARKIVAPGAVTGHGVDLREASGP